MTVVQQQDSLDQLFDEAVVEERDEHGVPRLRSDAPGTP